MVAVSAKDACFIQSLEGMLKENQGITKYLQALWNCVHAWHQQTYDGDRLNSKRVDNFNKRHIALFRKLRSLTKRLKWFLNVLLQQLRYLSYAQVPRLTFDNFYLSRDTGRAAWSLLLSQLVTCYCYRSKKRAVRAGIEPRGGQKIESVPW